MQLFLNKLKQNFIYFFTSELLVFISAFVAAYCYALFLGPYTYGYWQTAKIFIGYSTVLGLSLHLVMRRDFVMLLAEGKKDEAYKLGNIVFTYQIFFIPVVSLLIFLYALFFIKDSMLRITTITIGAIYTMQLIGGFGNILSKGLNNYKLIRNANVLNSALTFTAIPLVYVWGYYALLISTIIITIINSAYYYFTVKFDFKIEWDWPLFKKMLIISLPIYFQEISSTVFESIDRLLIAKYLTVEAVGFYSLSGMVSIPLRLLISTFSVVLFTQLNSEHGYEKDFSVIRKHVILPQSILSYIVAPFLLFLLILVPYVVRIFLPAYVSGITATQISVIASFFFLMSSFSANALFILDKQKISALIFLTIGLINSGLCIFALKHGWGINGAAAATFIAYLCYDIIMIGSIYRIMGQKFSDFLSHLLYVLLPIAYVIGCVLVYFIYIDSKVAHFSGGSIVKSILISGSIALVIAAPLFYLAFRKLKPYITNLSPAT